MTEATPLSVLLATAVTVAAGHTVIGIDHTLPFVAMGRARRWSLRRTLVITAACGLGHVASSMVLGLVGVALGSALGQLQWLQSSRASLASWSLIAFGAFFAARALVRSQRAASHAHAHAHADGMVHDHTHDHRAGHHVHVHATTDAAHLTVWPLFVIFVLGPCEPMIPLLMAPAALGQWVTVGLVALTFGAVTIGAMVALVAGAMHGASYLRLPALERHAELLAGVAIAGSGVAIELLGL